MHCPQSRADEVAGAVGAAAVEAGQRVFGPTPVRFPVTTAVVSSYADAKCPRPSPGHARSGQTAAAALGCSVPQYLHLEAPAGRSLDRHAGQVLTGTGSP